MSAKTDSKEDECQQPEIWVGERAWGVHSSPQLPALKHLESNGEIRQQALAWPGGSVGYSFLAGSILGEDTYKK